MSLNGLIYAIGGRSDANDVQSTYICETNYVRNGVCACVFMVEYLLLETVMLKTNL